MALEDLTYRDYARILRRRWKLAAGAALVGAVAGILAARAQAPAPIYDAASTVLYEPWAGFELTAGVVPPEQGHDLAGQIILIRGVRVLGAAAKRLGLIPADTPRERLEEYGPVINELRGRMDVVIDRGMLWVHGRDSTPEGAAGLANAVAGAYKEENVYELKKFVIKKREFIEKQLAENEKAMNEAQLAYEHYRHEHPMAAAEPGAQGTIAEVAQREGALQQVSGKIDEVRRQLALVQSGRPVSDLGIQTIVGGSSTARLTQLSTAFTQLNLDRARMLTELTEEHPLVRQKNQQLDAVRADLAAELRLNLEAFQKQEEEAAAQVAAIRQKAEQLPEEAMELARLARQVKTFENLGGQLRQYLEEALLKDAGVTGQVTVMTAAAPPAVPVNPPPYVQLGGLGFAGGLFAGFLLGLVLESGRFSVQALREIEAALDAPVLSINPRATPETLAAWLPSGKKPRRDTVEWSRCLGLAVLLAPRSPFSEAFRTLRASLAARLGAGGAAFTVTAAHLGEGVTTTAINLALSFGQAGQRVLLVESDFRHPTISTIFGVQREPGLVDFLLGSCTLEEATRGVADFVTGSVSIDEILLGPGLDNVHVMPCGTFTPTSDDALGSATFDQVLGSHRSSYDVILFDGPALAVSSMSLVLGKHSDVVLVFSPDRTTPAELETAFGRLRQAECSVVGLFVNGMESENGAGAPEREPAVKAAL